MNREKYQLYIFKAKSHINKKFYNLKKDLVKYKFLTLILLSLILVTVLINFYITWVEKKATAERKQLEIEFLEQEKKDKEAEKEKRVSNCNESIKDRLFSNDYKLIFNSQEYEIKDEPPLDIISFNEEYNNLDQFSSLEYSKALNVYIYLTPDHPQSYKDGVLKEIKVYDVKESKLTTIFSLKTELEENISDIRNGKELRSFSLSPDQKKLLILTDTELFIYDLESKKFTNSYSPRFNPEFPNENFTKYLNTNRHYFVRGEFTPDNKNAILMQAYWETGRYFIYNFESESFRPLGLTMGNAYSGDGIIKLTDNTIYYWSKLEDRYQICKDNFLRSSEQCVQDLPFFESPESDGILIGNKLYYLINEFDEDHTFFVCNDNGEAREWHYSYLTLLEINVNTMTSNSILKVNNSFLNKESGSFRIIKEYIKDSQSGLLLSTKTNNENGFAFLNLQNYELSVVNILE